MSANSNFKKVLIINVFLLAIGAFGLHYLHKLEALNPISKAFEDYSMTDFYFSKIRPNESENIDEKLVYLDKENPDIYIVDIGDKSKIDTRLAIANLLKKIDLNITTKAIGIDVLFKGETTYSVDSFLISQINKVKPTMVCNIETVEVDGKYEMYYNNSFISEQNSFKNIEFGFTNLLVEKNTPATDRYFVPQVDLEVENGSKDHFTLEMIKSIDQRKYNQFIDKFDEKEPQIINYRGDYRNHVIPIEEIDDRLFELKDKIILIGQCTYSEHPTDKGAKMVPRNNEDAHFTPKNPNYIGKSYPDMNGVEIHAHIISSIISERNDGSMDVIWSNKLINTIVTIVFSILIYFFQLYWGFKSSVSYKVVKHTLQLGLVLICLFISLWLLKNDIYFDLTTIAIVSFFTPEVIEITEGFTHKIEKYIEKFKHKSNDTQA